MFPALILLLNFASAENSDGIFSGRVSRVNPTAKLLRVKVNFTNIKYLNKTDIVEFGLEVPKGRMCKSHLLGKSGGHLLLKVPRMEFCGRLFSLHPGAYLKFFSRDLVSNIKQGRELVGILLKKRLALGNLASRSKNDLKTNREKFDAINQRYLILRKKLEAEWQEALEDVERDQMTNLEKFQKYQGRLAEIDRKLELYRIGDDNLEKDRWALDNKLHFEK